jgi:hypothetical protein
MSRSNVVMTNRTAPAHRTHREKFQRKLVTTRFAFPIFFRFRVQQVGFGDGYRKGQWGTLSQVIDQSASEGQGERRPSPSASHVLANNLAYF